MNTDRLILVCPHCKFFQSKKRDETDPPKAAKVFYPCPECQLNSGESVWYEDAQGKPVLPDWLKTI